MIDMAALKNEVAMIPAETAHIDFKSRFDPDAPRDWCEIIKDIVAMHNSEGGVVVFGLDSFGCDAGDAAGLVRPVDPAHVIDKVRKYTGQVLRAFRIEDFERNGKTYKGWVIPTGEVPVPFKEPGTWEKPDRKQETVFSRGQLYFRHGAMSEHASFEDMLAWRDRVSDSARRRMYEDMGKIVSVPPGHSVQIVPEGVAAQVPTLAERVRITDDPTAPGCVVVDKFKTHPYRRKDLIEQLVTRIQGASVIGFDIQCIRKVYEPELRQLDLVYEPPHASPHYSDALVDWIGARINENPRFVEDTRAKYRQPAAA